MQRRFRLRRNEDFVRLRREGRTTQNRFLLISVRANGLDHNRYGFVTSKHLGKAVVRNRVRRLLREAVRLRSSRLQTGFDVVLIARQPLVEQPFQSVGRIVEELFVQAHLLSESGVTR
jgi:ribonuclease P protein component